MITKHVSTCLVRAGDHVWYVFKKDKHTDELLEKIGTIIEIEEDNDFFVTLPFGIVLEESFQSLGEAKQFIYQDYLKCKANFLDFFLSLTTAN